MQRILIYSTDPLPGELIRFSLFDLPIEIRQVGSAEQLYALTHRVLFDLVLVVGTSLFITGRDVVRELRPAGLRRPMICVVTWQQSEQAVLSLLECGVDQYLTFPLNLQRLRAKIAHELTI